MKNRICCRRSYSLLVVRKKLLRGHYERRNRKTFRSCLQTFFQSFSFSIQRATKVLNFYNSKIGDLSFEKCLLQLQQPFAVNFMPTHRTSTAVLHCIQDFIIHLAPVPSFYPKRTSINGVTSENKTKQFRVPYQFFNEIPLFTRSIFC
jgi:hypothetical protein